MKVMSTSLPGRLVDRFGRQITYLRVSLTRDCNLSCLYCRHQAPSEVGIPGQLSVGGFIKVIQAFSQLGVNKVRFTGGEPLMHPHMTEIIAQTSAIPGLKAIGLTTNGLLLEPLLPRLLDAGLNRLNVSLDSLDRATYKAITGVDGLSQVLAGITAALECGAFNYIKINTVVMRGINDKEIPSLVFWALSRRIDLRFIELMPSLSGQCTPELFISAREIRQRIGLELEPAERSAESSGPATSFRYGTSPGRISFISATSRRFCHTCNRLRLSPDGKLHGCLFLGKTIDLSLPRIESLSCQELAERIASALLRPGFRRWPRTQAARWGKNYVRAPGG